MKFGFFDSGLGGLLMMQSCMKQYPEHSYVYIGDTKNLPYGPRESDDIHRVMSPYLCWLLEKGGCDIVIVACNTASVKALEFFYTHFPEYKESVIGISHSTTEYLHTLDAQHPLLVLATQGTVTSGVYGIHPMIQQIAMPGLVNLIESGNIIESIDMVIDALSYFPETPQVFLGCTHYVWLREDLQKLFPQKQFIGQDIIIQNLIADLVIDKQKVGHVTTAEYYVSGTILEYRKKYNLPFKKLLL